MPRLPAIVGAVGVVLALGGAACRSDTVRIGFRPAEGARYHYAVDVRSVTVTRIEGQPEQREYRAQGMQGNQRIGALSPVVNAVTVP